MEENININSKSKPKIIHKPTQCDICGACVSWFNKARHLRTKKHKDAVYVQFLKFEIK